MNRIVRILLSAALAVSPLISLAQQSLSLIPLPQKVEQTGGSFSFPALMSASAPAYEGDSVRAVLQRFTDKFTASTGVQFKQVKGKAKLLLRLDASLAPETYRLNVDEGQICIDAARPAGFFYALQTLQQLLPSRQVLAGAKVDSVTALAVPCVQIEDAPRFGWRGFMLDEGRHFFGKKEVEKIIDAMAAYKMNRFHWHLTEDQGWRIEIKKYPELTTTGAWRHSRVLGWGSTRPDGERYGGFYTQDDIREVVAYARDRFIEIVPEVDIPGHSQAAVASYPNLLACDPENAHDVWLYQGVSADVINVSNPQAVQFAKDVVDELTNLFPFDYIHLGGDECPVDKWRANAGCQAQLKALGSTNYRDLQINFYRQLKEHIAQKPKAEQRKLIFWNEVLHGNTAPLGTDITVMAWVGADAAAKDAAQRGLTTILTPQIPYYINRRQSKDVWEPRSQGYGTETVEAVYNYVPQQGVDSALCSKYLGVQANFWTEWVENAPTLQYLMFPRLAAVAEAAWTPQTLRKYPDFVRRLQQEPSFYRAMDINFGKHVFPSETAR